METITNLVTLQRFWHEGQQYLKTTEFNMAERTIGCVILTSMFAGDIKFMPMNLKVTPADVLRGL